MSRATGFQVAVLILAPQLLVAALVSRGAIAVPWEAMSDGLLVQAILFPAAALVLATVKPLRRACLEELARPLPPGARMELALVTPGTVAIPFGLAGAIVVWAFARGEPSALATHLHTVDPMRAWESTLSAPGIAKLVLLTWTLGPIVEELVFRGFLYRAWERQWGWLPSLFLTSACFALSHPSTMGVTFLVSIVLVCLLRRTGTLRACILAHMAYNALLSWPFLGRYALTLEGRELARSSTWAVELSCLVFLAIALPVYVALSRTDARAAPAR